MSDTTLMTFAALAAPPVAAAGRLRSPAPDGCRSGPAVGHGRAAPPYRPTTESAHLSLRLAENPQTAASVMLALRDALEAFHGEVIPVEAFGLRMAALGAVEAFATRRLDVAQQLIAQAARVREET